MKSPDEYAVERLKREEVMTRKEKALYDVKCYLQDGGNSEVAFKRMYDHGMRDALTQAACVCGQLEFERDDETKAIEAITALRIKEKVEGLKNNI